MRRRMWSPHAPGFVLGAVLIAAGYLLGSLAGGSGRAIADWSGAEFQVGADAPAMIGVGSDGFAIITGASGRYFHVNENGKARAISTEAGEFIDWK